MPETITISKDEYERLKSQAIKLKLIDSTIHENITSDIMELQEKQKSLDFLNNKEEDIYTINDLGEIWKKEQ